MAAANPHRNYKLIDMAAMIIGILNRDEMMTTDNVPLICRV